LVALDDVRQRTEAALDEDKRQRRYILVPMFIEDFNPTQRLATEVCPRCHTVGLAVPDAQTYANTSEADHHVEIMSVCPNITAWCPTCGLVGNWPGMCWESEPKPKRERKGHSEIA
jgi:hypothetical protein